MTVEPIRFSMRSNTTSNIASPLDIKNEFVSSIAATPQEVVIRSLRRRLWRAMESEQGDAALEIFKATRLEWEEWELQESMEKQKKLLEEQERKRRASRGSLFLKKNNNSKAKQQQLKSSSGLVTSLRSTMEGDFGNSTSTSNKQQRDNNADASASAVGLLQLCMNPSDPFVLDDYKDPHDPYLDLESTGTTNESAAGTSPLNRTSSHNRHAKHRTAMGGFWGRRGSAAAAASAADTAIRAAAELGATTTESEDFMDNDMMLMQSAAAAAAADVNATTPLHEAARLGHAAMVQCMLMSNNDTNPNFRNGAGRTALHMVSGGVTALEATRYNNKSNARVIGIRAPVSRNPLPEDPSEALHAKAARAVARIFKPHSATTTTTEPQGPVVVVPETKKISQRRWNELVSDRTHAARALMQWSHPDDGSAMAGQGSSTNAVDRMHGRTALHYAAELGRTDVCQALATSFGCLLTVVDDGGRTPCELAAAMDYKELAATLEAQALLYVDPYGMNDELLAAVSSGSDHSPNNNNSNNNQSPANNNSSRVPPFSWFETWSSLDTAQQAREQRLEAVYQKIQKVLVIDSEEKAARAMLGDGDSNSESSLNNSDDEENINDNINNNNGESNNNSDTEHSNNNSGDDGDDDEEEEDAKPEAVTVSAGEESRSDESEVYYDAEQQLLLQQQQQLDSKPSSKNSSDPDDDRLSLIFPTTRKRRKAKDLSVLFDGLHQSHLQIYLTHHHWDVQKALLAFIEDPFKAFFEQAHVPPIIHKTKKSKEEEEGKEERVCLICCDSFESDSPEWKSLSGCHHAFCRECLGDYIVECAKSKSCGLAICCPHHECEILLSPLEIASLAPESHVYEQLLETENKNFIMNAADVRFCPHPGCEGMVQFQTPTYVKKAGLDPALLHIVGAVCTLCGNGKDNVSSLRNDCSIRCIPRTYEGVPDPKYTDSRSSEPPRRAHRFCFACGEPGMHWPVSCSRLEEWKAAVEEQIKEVRETTGDGGGVGDSNDTENYNDLAQKLWLKTNTRPCPKCKAPIEKNEGCNHMICSNPHCKYEFCWICRKDWKLHSTDTGGFYLCNRWIDDKEQKDLYDTPPPDPELAARSIEDMDHYTQAATYGTAKHASRTFSRKSRAMARFLHHYQRWNAHAESATLERNMGETSCTRLAPVVKAAVDFNGFGSFNFGGEGLAFVHDAFCELLECRSMLQHSYAFSFFRYNFAHGMTYRAAKRRMNEKAGFEQLQSELEMLTEQMSDVVARLHLRATQAQIKFLTAITAEKRKEFSNLMISIYLTEQKEAGGGVEKNDSKKKRMKRSRKKMHGLLDDITLTLGTTGNNPQLSLAANTGNSEESPAPASGLLNNGLEDDLEEAIRASLADFMTSTGGGREAVMNDDHNDDNDDEDTAGDWACAACTFVNPGGRHCEMCGSSR